MKSVYRYDSVGMIIGDAILFILSLFIALSIRYLELPTADLFFAHIEAFMPVFVIWLVFYALAGLYDKHLRFTKQKLMGKLWLAQSINVIFAFLYFYLLKTSDIANGLTPKTILIIYLVISGIIITCWRKYIYPTIITSKPIKVVCLGQGLDFDKVASRKNDLLASGIDIVTTSDVSVFNSIAHTADIIVTNSRDKDFESVVDGVYELLFKGVAHVDFADFYEQIFEMIPFESVDKSWFLRHVTVERRYVYDSIKRLMDIFIALPLAIASLPFYPFVILGRLIENKGPIWTIQGRVGENGRIVNIIKFSSMTGNDAGKVIVQNDNRITPFGKFIRKSRIDELPQLWNILRGDLSLIGPRPEMPPLVEHYTSEIPHYQMRHVIKPGLSGWAQIHHDVPPQSVEATKVKLAYDLYYIKNRNIILDLKIAFATLKTLLSRTGL